VEWAGPVAGTAREILASAEQVEEDGSDSDSLKEFLRHLLTAGPMSATAVFRDGEAHALRRYG